MWFQARRAGRAALRALRQPGKVFASFERSFYVETPLGIACLGGEIGLGPLNAQVLEFKPVEIENGVRVDLSSAEAWIPRLSISGTLPTLEIPRDIRGPAKAFLDWIANEGEPDDTLIGLGSGLTPAGDDFVGGAMIALRAAGHPEIADRIARWALPLARERTNRISRAHLECAAQGEGHEALHDYLDGFAEKHLARLARIGHSSGLDAAAGAVLGLGTISQEKIRASLA